MYAPLTLERDPAKLSNYKQVVAEEATSPCIVEKACHALLVGTCRLDCSPRPLVRVSPVMKPIMPVLLCSRPTLRRYEDHTAGPSEQNNQDNHTRQAGLHQDHTIVILLKMEKFNYVYFL